MKLCVVDCETTGLDPMAGHEIWEIGLIVREQDDLIDGYAARKETEYLWRIKPDLTKADPEALRKGRFYDRTDGMVIEPVEHPANLTGIKVDAVWSDPAEVAGVLAFQLNDGIVVGANPGFDKDFIRPFLRQYGQAYTAHYRPICVTTFAAGFIYGMAAGYTVGWNDIAKEANRCARAFERRGEDFPLAPTIFEPGDRRPVVATPGLPWSSNAVSAAVGVKADDYDRHTALGDCRWALAQLDAVMGGGGNG